MRFFAAILASASLVLLLGPGTWAAGVDYEIDGLNIKENFCGQGIGNCPALLSVQTNHTAFGDTFPATGNYTPGSEINQMFVFKTQDSLGVYITGNLEPNGNAIVIFLDVREGGQNILSVTSGPGAVTGQSGTKFDAGFEPDWAISINTGGGQNAWVDLVDLQNNSNRYIGFVPLNAPGVLTGGQNPNGSVLGFNNTNNAGVLGSAGQGKSPAETQLDAETAIKGIELMINLADLGVTSAITEAKVMAVVTGNSGFYSNQFLPGIGADGQKGNLGFGPIDLSNQSVAPGNQYATVNVSQTRNPNGPVDGDNIPFDAPAGSRVAVQNNYTGFGDGSGTGTPGSNGSELNALFMTDIDKALKIGITGNLESNGNYWLIFLETGPDGVSPNGMAVPSGVGPVSGVLQGLNGTLFDFGFSPTHVVMMDCQVEDGTTWAYFNIFDLRNNLNTYLGRVEVGSGTNILQGGENPFGVLAAFNNSNAAGVTSSSSKTAAENEADALTANTGLEMLIPYRAIGLSQAEIRFFVLLTGNRGFVSNQMLPGLPGGFGNLNDPPVFFPSLAGIQFGTYTITDLPNVEPISLQEIRGSSDGRRVQVTSTVSAAFPMTSDFYIQDSLPVLVGIRVAGDSFGLEVGDLVTVTGWLTRQNGERTILAENISKIGTGALPTPVAMGNQQIAGGSLGLNPGKSSGGGVNNVGLLGTSWGTLTGGPVFDFDGSIFFHIDDGSRLFDGNDFMWPGIRIECPPDLYPDVSGFVKATGVISLYQKDGLLQPRLRVRTQDDLESTGGPLVVN